MNFRMAHLQLFVDENKIKSSIAEDKMNEILRDIGETYTYQYPIRFNNHWYILDFYLHDHRVAIEVDGDYHYSKRQKDKDRRRDIDLSSQKIFTIRFKNDDVIKNRKHVINRILCNLNYKLMVGYKEFVKCPYVVDKNIIKLEKMFSSHIIHK